MILRSYKDVYKEVSKTLNISVDTVSNIGTFIWNDLAKRLEDFDKREIYVYGLGSFRFRKERSESYIKKVENIGKKLAAMNAIQSSIDKAEITVAEKVEKLKRLIAEWDILINNRREHYKIKKEYANRNIQKSKIDLGGIEK